jgi:hypothetical protein
LTRPEVPRGAGNLKFTIYVPVVPKMHHTKFEKNLSSGYLEEVINVQMLTDDRQTWIAKEVTLFIYKIHR